MNHVSRIIHFVFIFSIPFQARLVLAHWTTPFNEWTAGFLWGTDILFVALIILNFSAKGGSASGGKFLNKKDLVLGGFLLVALISIHYALIPQVAWYRFFKLAEYILVFFYFRNTTFPVAWPIALSAGFQALVAILQYAFQHSLGLWFLGESPLVVGQAGVATVVAQGHEYLRAYGTFPHPNLLAVWLLLGLWFAVVLRKKALFALMLIAFFLTFSRVAIAVGALSLIFYMPKTKKIISAFLGIVLTFSIIFWPQISSRLHIETSDEAVAQRVFYTEIAWQSFREHPITGIGIGQFVPLLMERLPIYPDFIYQPVHNIFLLILAELGIFGLLAFLFLLYFSLRKHLFVLFCIVILGFFDHYFWTLQQGGLIFWGLLGYLARDKIITDDQSR